MERVIRLGAINIVTQPHSAPKYQRLLLKVRNRRKAVRIRSDRFGMIAFMTRTDTPGAAGAYVQGLIGTFTQIEEDGDWISLSKGKNAEKEELAEINIPTDLRPNPLYFHFRFYLREHMLIFETGNGGAKLTPRNAAVLFERLFSADTIINEFGEVAVTPYPNAKSVSSILNHPGLRVLHLVIHAPNPDDGKAAERSVMRRLERMNAQRIEEHVVSKKDKKIEPDKQLVQEAKIASKNGKVEALVVSQGRTIQLSTLNHPYLYTHSYSDEVSTEEGAFGEACEAVRHQLRGKG